MQLGTPDLGAWVNYVATNHLPRRAANRLMLSVSRNEHPWIAKPALWLWQRFADIDLTDARTTQFKSVHDCFTRELKVGARPVDQDPAALVSPCDGHIVATGCVERGQLLQVKGSNYPLAELLCDKTLAARFEGGTYITIRITSSMYHRMHAPADLQTHQLDYIPGDSFNVNPQTLRHLDGVYCKNERVVIHSRAQFDNTDVELLIIPVAAILVGGIVLRCLPAHDSKTEMVVKEWAQSDPCGWTSERKDKHVTRLTPAPMAAKGDELGRFEHGSTIVLILPQDAPTNLAVTTGTQIQAGQRLATIALQHSPTTPSRPPGEDLEHSLD